LRAILLRRLQGGGTFNIKTINGNNLGKYLMSGRLTITEDLEPLLRECPGANFEALREPSLAAKLQLRKRMAAHKLRGALRRLF